MNRTRYRIIGHFCGALISIFSTIVCFGQEETYDGGNLTSVTITEDEARGMVTQLLDVSRFIHSIGVGSIAKDNRLQDFAEGFVERNGIEVLTIGYIDSEEFWPRIFKNIRLKKIERANTDELLTGHIMFVPVMQGNSIVSYKVEFMLEGKTDQVYELLKMPKETVELIASEANDNFENTTYNKPSDARDEVVDAMIAALQRVEGQASGTADEPEVSLVTFSPAPNQSYGFDAPLRDELSSDYLSVNVNGTSVKTSWKSLKSNMPDQVMALDSSGQSVAFEYNSAAVTVTISQDSSAYSMQVNGASDGAEGELVAKVGNTVAGKLYTISYNVSDVKVKVVPINGAGGGISQSVLQQALNEIYGPAVATWQVEVMANQNLGTAWDDEGNGLQDGESGMLSNYTDEMNDLIKAFKNKNGRDKNVYYVFLVDRAENASKLGYMPRKKQWGFIFTSGRSTEEITTTIAHELGHGVYHLEHTFSEKGIPQNQTQNLMDYAGGRELYKYQWDLVHNPASVITLFEDDQEGAYVSETQPEELARILNYIYCGASSGKAAVEAHYGWEVYDAKLGTLLDYLDFAKT